MHLKDYGERPARPGFKSRRSMNGQENIRLEEGQQRLLGCWKGPLKEGIKERRRKSQHKQQKERKMKENLRLTQVRGKNPSTRKRNLLQRKRGAAKGRL